MMHSGIFVYQLLIIINAMNYFKLSSIKTLPMSGLSSKFLANHTYIPLFLYIIFQNTQYIYD